MGRQWGQGLKDTGKKMVEVIVRSGIMERKGEQIESRRCKGPIVLMRPRSKCQEYLSENMRREGPVWSDNRNLRLQE